MPVLRLPSAASVLSPFAVLVTLYAVYFALVYSRIYEYVYWELMNLGTRIIGFHPSARTLGLYAYAGVVLLFGFVLGIAVARRAHSDVVAVENGPLGGRVSARSSSARVLRAVGPLFALCLVGWAGGLTANGLQIVASGGASITDIATRWHQSPVLVWFAASQIFFVPALIVTGHRPWQKALTGLCFVISIVALGLLGARNLPAKLVISAFLATVYVVKPRSAWRLAAVFLILLVLAMGVVGALSKSGIYGPSATAGLALGLTYSDSAGTVYNLDRIVRLTPSLGAYHGKLLRDSLLALVPGYDAEYANYQLGKYLSGRGYFMIGQERIERSVSLAPTLLGAPYADWGVPGVVGQMLLLGFLFGYLQARSAAAKWTIPFLVTFASYTINGINAGVHNPHAIVATGAALIAVLADLLAGRYSAWSARPSTRSGRGQEA